MNTLHVLLPVHNAHDILERSLSEILDVLPELAERFEVLILDDGSTDDTVDIAVELAKGFPQVRLISHPVRLGLAESIQSGFDHISAEQLLVGDANYNLEPDDLRLLWQLRETRRPAAGRAGTEKGSGAIDLRKALAWKSTIAGGRGLFAVERKTFDHLRLKQSLAAIARIDRASRTLQSTGLVRPNFLGTSGRFVEQM